MEYFERITVALCSAPVDADVLRYARLVHDMGEGGVEMSFVHVLPPVDGWRDHGGTPQPLDEVRAALRAVVTEHYGEVSPEAVQVLSGSHLDKLLETVAELHSDLLLLGHRRSARGRRSSSRRLAMKAPCSVWMVPEGCPARISHILAAVDFSRPSARAASLATLIASRRGDAACTVLHVVEPNPLGLDDVAEGEARRDLEAFLAPLDLHGIEIDQAIVEGGSVAGVTAGLVRTAGVDVLVLGTRGRSGSAAVLLGSESEGVLLESSVPVLVTKDRGERLGIVRELLDRDFRSTGLRFG
jgi:nucleotide-binding universal stress UspA family protein